MINLILILLGLITNPYNNSSSNSTTGSGENPTTTSQPPTITNPGDTGGDNGQVPPRK